MNLSKLSMRSYYRRLVLILLDIIMVPIAWYGAYWLRFNLDLIPKQELLYATYLLPCLILIQFLVFWILGLYRGLWKFTSLPDFVRILKAVVFGVTLSLIVLFFIPFKIPRSVVLIYAWLLVSFLGGTRFLYRWFKNYYSGNFKEGKRSLIVGAGQAADLLIREFFRNTTLNSKYNVVAIVDDDISRQGCEIHGIRVIGSLNDIPDVISKYDIEQVVIAMPSANATVVRRIIDYCRDANIESSTIPNLNDIVSGNVAVSSLREVSLEDLLGREQVKLDWSGISKIISGKKIIVSGGGGSIGSELCLQIANLAPSVLVIIDNSEYNLYTVDKVLREKFPQLQLVTFLIDVSDLSAVQYVMRRYQADIVFHAAAYKHVPILEHQARFAIKNNVLGTYNIAKTSLDNGVKTFVLISTDKAVNPVNVMGATKRAAEVICQNLNGIGLTHFITVRFGNVLGSAGSVIPLFKEQLAAGKDLTVTHQEVTRYFMTIPEATQLILQATALGKNGEIFVLDMGEPIKIRELAEQMIYLSGKKLGEDVNIKYIGLRPGEKLYEELFYSFEELIPTDHMKIRQAKYQAVELGKISACIDNLGKLYNTNEGEEKFIELLLEMVPEYQPIFK